MNNQEQLLRVDKNLITCFENWVVYGKDMELCRDIMFYIHKTFFSKKDMFSFGEISAPDFAKVMGYSRNKLQEKQPITEKDSILLSYIDSDNQEITHLSPFERAIFKLHIIPFNLSFRNQENGKSMVLSKNRVLLEDLY